MEIIANQGVKMRKLEVRKTVLLVLMIIVFIYFEINSCSDDRISAPELNETEEIDNKICFPRDIYFLDETFGLVVGASGTAMYTRDGGENWKGIRIGNSDLRGAFLLSRSEGWVVGEDGTLFKTVDGCLEWSRLTFNGYPQDTDLYRVEFMSDTLGFIQGYGGVYRTNDGGMNWENHWLPIVPYRGSWDMSLVNDKKGYLLGSRWSESDPNLIYKTSDGGLSWFQVEGTKSSVLEAVLAIYFVDDTIGWVGGNKIKKTNDGGESWVDQLQSAHVRRFFFINREDGFAVGGLKILKTSDGGETWSDTTPDDERIKDVRSVYFVDENTGWVLTWGYDEKAGDKLIKNTLIFKTCDGGNTWESKEFSFDYSTLAESLSKPDEI